MTRLLIVLLLASLAGGSGPGPSTSSERLVRRYTEGERLVYVMKGTNNRSTYEVRITGFVKKGADGRFFEEYAWSDLVVDGRPRELPETSKAFRHALSLDAGGPPFSAPDLSKALQLIGPVTDLMTFYADLFVALHKGTLREPGDHFDVPSPATGSWADGTYVLVGEAALDLALTLTEVDEHGGVARLLIKHVPPDTPQIRIPAAWMREPVADTPNNHVQVRKAGAKYVASIGKETFDVALEVSLADGRIVSATMENRVEEIARDCRDIELTDCGEARPSPTVRHIEMALVSEESLEP